MADERGSEVVGSPGLVSAVPAGLKSTFSKLFGSSWTSNETPDSPAGSGHGGGLIAAFRAMMPKSGSGSGGLSMQASVDCPRTPQGCTPLPPTSPGGKSTLLAVCPQLPPSMQRKEWCLEDYVITDKLYKGYASMVYKAICKRSREVVVLKCYLMSSICELYQHQIYREVRLHSTCAHENIIRLIAAFQEGDRVVMVQEFADGGDLFNLLHKYGGCLSERIAVQMVLDPFLRVLQYLHTRAIIHRDIKPENILFADTGSCLKLADFGLAIDCREERAVTRAGTLDYMAPEVLRCPYKSKPEENKDKAHLHYSNTVDSWAVGVLVYELLVGCPPFYDKSKSNTEARIVSGVPSFPPTVSEAAKSFICAALRKNPEERPSVLEMVHHPWVELYRARRSMRQLNLVLPGDSTASCAADTPAAPVPAAGAAATNAASEEVHNTAAAHMPAMAPQPQQQQQQQQQKTQAACTHGSGRLAGTASRVAHAVAAPAAAVKSLKRTDAKLAGGHKEGLLLHLSAASSPCLLQTPGAAAPGRLLKAALAGSAAAATAAAAGTPPGALAHDSPKSGAPCTPTAGSGCAAALKGGSVKIEGGMTFLFASHHHTHAHSHAHSTHQPGNASAALTHGPTPHAAAEAQLPLNTEQQQQQQQQHDLLIPAFY